MRMPIVLALFLCAAACLPSAGANTITVDNASSGSVTGHCTLQDAVSAANTNAAVNGCAAGSAGLDTIVFASGITNIMLTSAMPSANPSCTFGLAVSEDLSIDGGAVAGSGIPKVTIARSSASGTANFGIIGASVDNCGPIHVTLNLTLAGLTISNANNTGNFSNNGGGVAADIVTITDSTISGNTAGNGGGIYAFTSLTMRNSTVSGNTATAGYSASGGGIAGQTMTISSSTISGNSAGLGSGGGISGGPITIDNSTISGNTAVDGGGIDTTAITAYFVTVTANNGGGDYRGASGVRLEQDYSGNHVEFDDTVIAGNSNTNNAQDLDTQISRPITGTNNYIATLGPTAQADLDNGVNMTSCPHLNLGPLANNGGGTQTHALLAGSCLIDAGGISSPGGFLFASDQRGRGYPRFVNTHADIGAFEYQGVATPVNGACGSDNAQTLLAAPVNLCSAGTASAVTGSGHPWSWTCAGNAGGSTASCSATIKTWTVSAGVSGAGGSVSPATQIIDNGATATVNLTPAGGYSVASATGCGSGSRSGNVYTSAPVTADCTITAAFSAAPVASLTLSSNANPVVAGQSLVLTATVTGNAATPTGSVTFFDGAKTLGSVSFAQPLHSGKAASAVLNSAGIASLTVTTLSVGTHALSASYSGDATYAGTVSTPITETVSSAPVAAAAISAPALSIWALLALSGLLVALGWHQHAAGRLRDVVRKSL